MSVRDSVSSAEFIAFRNFSLRSFKVVPWFLDRVVLVIVVVVSVCFVLTVVSCFSGRVVTVVVVVVSICLVLSVVSCFSGRVVTGVVVVVSICLVLSVVSIKWFIFSVRVVTLYPTTNSLKTERSLYFNTHSIVNFIDSLSQSFWR